MVETASIAPHVARRGPALSSPGARRGFARLLTLPRASCSLQLPLSLLRAGKDNPMLVELKNGETYNGILINCDIWYAPRAAFAIIFNRASCFCVGVLWPQASSSCARGFGVPVPVPVLLLSTLRIAARQCDGVVVVLAWAG